VMNNMIATAMTARVTPISWVKTAPSILRFSPFEFGRIQDVWHCNSAYAVRGI
jgi:hypothetical protein